MFNEKLKGVRFLVSKERFGNYIKEKRMTLGITQEEFAEKLYISPTAISKWENGKTYPDITIISQICNILKISEHEFVSACDDTEMRKMEYEARKYRKVKKATLWLINLAFAIPLVICLICNLVVDHTLSWFFIVTASLGIAYSILVLPIYIKKEKSFVALMSGNISIVLVIIFYWLFGNIGFSLINGLLILLFFSCFVWGIWAVIRFTKNKLAFTLMIIGTLIAITTKAMDFITREKSNTTPYINEIIGITFIVIGVIILVIKLLRTKK